MPCKYTSSRKRSKAGRELDLAYQRHEIGYTYYRKIWNKPIYWESL